MTRTLGCAWSQLFHNLYKIYLIYFDIAFPDGWGVCWQCLEKRPIQHEGACRLIDLQLFGHTLVLQILKRYESTKPIFELSKASNNAKCCRHFIANLWLFSRLWTIQRCTVRLCKVISLWVLDCMGLQGLQPNIFKVQTWESRQLAALVKLPTSRAGRAIAAEAAGPRARESGCEGQEFAGKQLTD